MIQKLKTYGTVLLTLLAFSAPMLVPATSYACNNIQSSINTGINNATGSSSSCGSGTTIQTGISSIAATIVNILSVVVGVVAIIMIIYGGFRYISSGGESNNVSSAKNTIIYAIVGLVIVALAQLIVHWVLNTSSSIVP